MHTVLFADDTTAYVSGSNVSDIFHIVSEDLNKIQMWCCSNRLSLNVSKTYGMLFSFTEHSIQPVELLNVPISFNSTGKFLGIKLDDRLSFGAQCTDVCLKLSKVLGILYRIQTFVPQKVLIQLYYSLFYPHLLYCTRIWGGTYSAHIHQIVVIQKKCIRIIAGVTYNTHTSPIFKRLNILKFNDVYKFQICQYMFKSVRSGDFTPPLHSYQTRQHSDIVSVFQRLTTTQKSIKYSGPKIWNDLPVYLREIRKFHKFKSDLKKYLISLYEES